MARKRHIFADRHLVLHDDEQAGYDVLHQRLRAEADGEAGNADAGQQRRDVDAELGSGRQPAHRQQQHGARAAQERQQRARPAAALHGVAVLVAGVEIALDGEAKRLPQDEEDADDQRDAHQRADNALAQRRRQQVQHRGAPRLQRRDRRDDPYGRPQRFAQDRHIAVGACLHARKPAVGPDFPARFGLHQPQDPEIRQPRGGDGSNRPGRSGSHIGEAALDR